MLNPSGEGPEIVARSEGRQFDHKPEAGSLTADREWILKTYFDWLRAVKGHRYGSTETTPQF